MTHDEIILPPPDLAGSTTLEKVILQRRSHRDFDPRPLSLEQVSQLAWAAQGITGDDSRWRTAPSAGALHPLELYLLYPEAAYRYDPAGNRLVPHPNVDLTQVAAAALNQRFIAQAPVVFCFAARTDRSTRVYKQRGRLYLSMDLGHAAQNLLLQAAALGLVGTPVGAFNVDQLKTALKLPADQEPLYLVPIGFPG